MPQDSYTRSSHTRKVNGKTVPINRSRPIPLSERKPAPPTEPVGGKPSAVKDALAIAKGALATRPEQTDSIEMPDWAIAARASGYPLTEGEVTGRLDGYNSGQLARMLGWSDDRIYDRDVLEAAVIDRGLVPTKPEDASHAQLAHLYARKASSVQVRKQALTDLMKAMANPADSHIFDAGPRGQRARIHLQRLVDVLRGGDEEVYREAFRRAMHRPYSEVKAATEEMDAEAAGVTNRRPETLPTTEEEWKQSEVRSKLCALAEEWTGPNTGPTEIVFADHEQWAGAGGNPEGYATLDRHRRVVISPQVATLAAQDQAGEADERQVTACKMELSRALFGAVAHQPEHSGKERVTFQDPTLHLGTTEALARLHFEQVGVRAGFSDSQGWSEGLEEAGYPRDAECETVCSLVAAAAGDMDRKQGMQHLQHGRYRSPAMLSNSAKGLLATLHTDPDNGNPTAHLADKLIDLYDIPEKAAAKGEPSQASVRMTITEVLRGARSASNSWSLSPGLERKPGGVWAHRAPKARGPELFDKLLPIVRFLPDPNAPKQDKGRGDPLATAKRASDALDQSVVGRMIAK